MKRLDLDLAPPRTRPVVVWVLLAAAAVLAADAVQRHGELADALDEAQSDAVRRDTRRPRAVTVDAATTRDFRQAEQVIDRLALPWDTLFRAIEGAAGQRVALLSMEPDARKGEVALGGEAADYAAVIDYVERLGQPGLLQGVHLVRHELREDEPGRPMRFVIVGRWGGGR